MLEWDGKTHLWGWWGGVGGRVQEETSGTPLLGWRREAGGELHLSPSLLGRFSFVFMFCSQGVTSGGSPPLPHAAPRPAGKSLPLCSFSCRSCCCSVSSSCELSSLHLVHPPLTQNPPCPIAGGQALLAEGGWRMWCDYFPPVCMVLVQAGDCPPTPGSSTLTPLLVGGVSFPPS